MKITNIVLAALLLLPLLFSCKSQQATVKEEHIEQFLYKKWQVRSIETPEKASTGKDMGDPFYEFTRTGERIKGFETPPHKESVRFERRADSIFYPDNPKLPAVRIVKISKDSLVLKSEKATWRLY